MSFDFSLSPPPKNRRPSPRHNILIMVFIKSIYDKKQRPACDLEEGIDSLIGSPSDVIAAMTRDHPLSDAEFEELDDFLGERCLTTARPT